MGQTSYAFCSIEKVKTMGTMVSKYNHNCRKVDVANADPSKAHLNDTLIALPMNPDGTEKNYAEVCRERIESIKENGHHVRKNAVLGMEVVLTYTSDQNIDIEEWKRASTEWLQDYFDVAGDGKSNVIHAMCHEDEKGNRHIHAIVIPVDERGVLCASSFTNGSRAMSEMQSSYAEAVEHLGLVRGVMNSNAEHTDIGRYYADLNNVIAKIPDPLEGETAMEYKERIIEHAKTLYAATKKAMDDYKIKIQRSLDIERNEQREAMEKEFSAREQIAKADIAELEEKKEELELECGVAKRKLQAMKREEEELREQREIEISDYERIVSELARQMYELQMGIAEEAQRLIDEHKAKQDSAEPDLENDVPPHTCDFSRE